MANEYVAAEFDTAKEFDFWVREQTDAGYDVVHVTVTPREELRQVVEAEQYKHYVVVSGNRYFVTMGRKKAGTSDEGQVWKQ